jgi:ABC-type transport system involved in cytochrome bd biosynthesis fused ATPase/permease subunit
LLRSHRLSSIRNADRIIVFGEKCDILEDGTHDELLIRENGVFTELWKRHLGIDEDDEKDTPSSKAPTSEALLIDI